jgi:activator of 2-hydroxyglutaryl-CoA dehydratase
VGTWLVRAIVLAVCNAIAVVVRIGAAVVVPESVEVLGAIGAAVPIIGDAVVVAIGLDRRRAAVR